MTPAKFICLREHPENVRWGLGCGAWAVGESGPGLLAVAVRTAARFM
jgi:hypothetical protein